jgi:hypothetical protein
MARTSPSRRSLPHQPTSSRRALLVSLGSAVAAVCGLALLTLAPACVGSSGNGQHAFTAEASGADEHGPFVNDFGWTVTLSRAVVRMGPIYLNTVAPLRAARPRFGLPWVRVAHAEDAHLGDGLVVGEVLTDAEINLLDDAPTRFDVPGLVTSDAIRTAEIRFWPGAGLSPEAKAPQPALEVAGEASKNGETIRFSGAINLDETWLPNARPGDRNYLTLIDIREVRGIPTSFTAQTEGTLRVRVDQRRLFASANFAQIRDNEPTKADPSVRQLRQTGALGPDTVTRSLYEALRSIRTYDVRWTP